MSLSFIGDTQSFAIPETGLIRCRLVGSLLAFGTIMSPASFQIEEKWASLRILLERRTRLLMTLLSKSLRALFTMLSISETLYQVTERSLTMISLSVIVVVLLGFSYLRGDNFKHITCRFVASESACLQAFHATRTGI